VPNLHGCSGQLHSIAAVIEPGGVLELEALVRMREAGAKTVNCQCLWDGGGAAPFQIKVEAAQAVAVNFSVSPSYSDNSK
jgi:hypothetical protein